MKIFDKGDALEERNRLCSDSSKKIPRPLIIQSLKIPSTLK